MTRDTPEANQSSPKWMIIGKRNSWLFSRRKMPGLLCSARNSWLFFEESRGCVHPCCWWSCCRKSRPWRRFTIIAGTPPSSTRRERRPMWEIAATLAVLADETSEWYLFEIYFLKRFLEVFCGISTDFSGFLRNSIWLVSKKRKLNMVSLASILWKPLAFCKKKT